VAHPRPRFDIADIVRRHLPDLEGEISPVQRKVLTAISRCRTPALGGHLDVCLECGREHPSYNSCGNRHCPKCQALVQERWIEARAKRLLPVGHFHVVFTQPADLRPLGRCRPRLLHGILFQAASATILELGRTHLEATLAVTFLLHTWTRDLRYHAHLHGLVSAGGLALDGSRWVPTSQKVLFHVHRMGALFKGKFMDLLRDAQARGELGLTEVAFNVLMAKLWKQKWVVYAKRPYREAWHALAYLGRYVHRVGIANSRILDDTGDQVTFRTKGKATATLPGRTFVRRFLLHVLPPQFTKVRHFGLYAFPRPGGLLEQARAHLGGREIPDLWRRPLPDQQEMEATQLACELPSARICPDCGMPMARTFLPRPRAPPATGAA
jgi:hypothetical protein